MQRIKEGWPHDKHGDHDVRDEIKRRDDTKLFMGAVLARGLRGRCIISPALATVGIVIPISITNNMDLCGSAHSFGTPLVMVSVMPTHCDEGHIHCTYIISVQSSSVDCSKIRSVRLVERKQRTRAVRGCHHKWNRYGRHSRCGTN